MQGRQQQGASNAYVSVLQYNSSPYSCPVMNCLELLLCVGVQMRVSVKAFLECSCDHSLQLGQHNPTSALQPLLTCQSLDSRSQTFH